MLYRTISNDFAEKLVVKNERKTVRGEAFQGLKNPENPGASGGSAPGPPPGRCPWTPPGALERAPGPHAVKTLHSLHFTLTQTIFIQHPAVTVPAHAHVKGTQNFKTAHPDPFIYFP